MLPLREALCWAFLCLVSEGTIFPVLFSLVYAQLVTRTGQAAVCVPVLKTQGNLQSQH